MGGRVTDLFHPFVVKMKCSNVGSGRLIGPETPLILCFISPLSPPSGESLFFSLRRKMEIQKICSSFLNLGTARLVLLNLLCAVLWLSFPQTIWNLPDLSRKFLTSNSGIYFYGQPMDVDYKKETEKSL